MRVGTEPVGRRSTRGLFTSSCVLAGSALRIAGKSVSVARLLMSAVTSKAIWCRRVSRAVPMERKSPEATAGSPGGQPCVCTTLPPVMGAASETGCARVFGSMEGSANSSRPRPEPSAVSAAETDLANGPDCAANSISYSHHSPPQSCTSVVPVKGDCVWLVAVTNRRSMPATQVRGNSTMMLMPCVPAAWHCRRPPLQCARIPAVHYASPPRSARPRPFARHGHRH